MCASQPEGGPISDIFLSYAKQDREKAKIIAKALADQGWSVWWDTKITPGKTFRQVIDEALSQARCVVVLWSRASVKKEWVEAEADEGQRRRILVPAVIDDVEITDIPLGFRHIQAASLTDWRRGTPHAGFDGLIEAITEKTNLRPEPPPRPPKGKPGRANKPFPYWIAGAGAVLAAVVLAVFFYRPPAPPSDSQQQIRRQLDEGRAFITSADLVTPEGENALERYQTVLGEDPGNQEAAQGIERIFGTYLDRADKSMASRQYVEAGKNLKIAAGIRPDDQRVLQAQAKLKKLKEDAQAAQVKLDKIERLLTEAESALAADKMTTPEGDNAHERYKAVLRLDRENNDAREGLARIVAKYLEWADKALARSELDTAVSHLNKADAVLPGDVRIQRAMERVESQRAEAAKSTAEKRTAETAKPTVTVERKRDEPAKPALKMVKIPAGSFTMGSNSGYSGERPPHTVTISRPFLMSKTEVTQGQWRVVMGNNPSYFPQCGDDCPVEQVNWWEALAFCNTLSKKDGLEACYELSECRNEPGEDMECKDVTFKGSRCDGYRLPTEAEWEYAARAGTETRFYTGDKDSDLDRAGWYGNNSGGQTHPVGEKEPNKFGLHDMHGNVWEWVEDDWHGSYEGAPVDGGRAWIDGPRDERRVFRGGSWYNVARDCRSAIRSYWTPGKRDDDVGFRLSRSVGEDG